MKLRTLLVVLGAAVLTASAQPPAPAPTYANLDYAPPEPATSNGHKLDLYIPAGATGPLPVVIWTGGSAWMADTGKTRRRRPRRATEPGGLRGRGRLDPLQLAGAVSGPAARHQGRHPLAAGERGASTTSIPNHIAIMGDSSGGWTAAMAAVTGDAPEMEGSVGHDRRVERGAGRGRVLSADELPDDGRLGAAEVRGAEVPRRRGVPGVAARRLRHPDLPGQGAGGQPAARTSPPPIRRS